MTLLFVAALAACAYQVIALLAALRHSLRRDPSPRGPLPGVSILKPIRGLDPSFWQAIRSHAEQDYPEFEILFGAIDPKDPALPQIHEFIRKFPDRQIRLIRCPTKAPNAKVGTLMDLEKEARYPILLVNDSDIEVPRGYLRNVVSHLERKAVGLVTCLYSAEAGNLPARWEALGISADFASSVLVARLTGVREFGLGSTLCFRAKQLRAIGGFAAIADYLADDYQLTRRITELGFQAVISRTPVRTHLGRNTWAGVWRHQVRWARTIRLCRGGGYLGLPLTHAGLWASLCIAAGMWWTAAALVMLRIAAGAVTAVAVLGDRRAIPWLPLVPLWDLWGFAVWIAGLSGKTVLWRGRRLRLLPDGRIPSDCA